ncbi:MAG: OmpH family outer membrane protein [Rubricoccaceae bacterium]|nr:OmpH family outer membrane protein [Rubricoccaceae bacterium]
MTSVRMIRSLLLATIMLAPLLGADAQTPRFGYLDPDIIIVQMPEYAVIRDSLQAREAEIAGELQADEDVIRQKFDELQQLMSSSVASVEAQQEREQEILQLQSSLEQKEMAGRRELARTEAGMLEPLLMRLQDAIDTVSAEEGLTMVFSARANNAPVILYASSDAVNITEEVMTELGIEMEQPEQQPGAGN